MPSVRILQSNFTAGEFSPRLFARVDLQRYPNGASELMNMVGHPQGGAQRRTGSYYCGAIKDAAARARLVPFTASTLVSYVLEFGDLYLRFWRDRAPLVAGGVPLEITTPWPTSALRELRFAQSVDVLYITCEGYQPRKLTRTATDTFNLAVAVFRDGPYVPENTGSPTVATGAGSSTSSGTTSAPTTGGTNDGGAAGTGGDAGGGGDGGGSGSGDGGGDGGGGDSGGGDSGGGAE